MKGYKAFEKGLICRDKQYSENTVFEETGDPVICEKGIHYCDNPLDTLSYYDITTCEFAEVEPIGKIVNHHEDSKKATNKIKIGAKLDLPGFIKASFSFLWETCKQEKNSSQSAQSGYYSQSAQSGNYSQSAQSGYYSQSAQSGDSSQSAQSGDSSKSAQSGYYSQSAQSGDSSQSAQSGNYSKSAQSGYYSSIELNGLNCVGANIGENGKIKGVLGSWITLAEYDDNGICICVKSVKIDGKKLLSDTWYTLKNKKFVVCE